MGRMHSKLQGFSTQPTAQPVHWHVSSQWVSEMLHWSTWEIWAQYPRRAPNCQRRGEHVAPGAPRRCPQRAKRKHDKEHRAHRSRGSRV